MNTAISFFNNKGGVGKTTLACNFAAYASKAGYSVTVVDCDPQANATQLLLPEDKWISIYDVDDRGQSASILEPLREIREGDSSIYDVIPTLKSPRFGVSVLPGHPRLAQVEDIFSSSWTEFRGHTLGAARRTLWARTLRKHIKSDLIVFDMSPSLGALNRTVLIGSDFFVTPVEADLFSLYALENIGDWISEWVNTFEKSNLQYKEDRLFSDLKSALQIKCGWIGYTVQQYVSRTKDGIMRDIKSYDRYKAQIPERAKRLEAFKSVHVDVQGLNVGVIPNMFSMIPMAQAAHSPIFDLGKDDGLRGGQPGQRDNYVERLDVIFSKILSNAGLRNA